MATMQEKISRSYLFVPATRIERVPKAFASGAHAVIVDLEDAVAPADKRAARDMVARGCPNAQSVLIRINGPDTEWFEDDVKLCGELRAPGVVVSKAETPEQLRHVASQLPAGALILPLVETARGYANIATLCAVSGVQRLMFGNIDFQLDLGIDGNRDELLYFRSGIVLASTSILLYRHFFGVNNQGALSQYHVADKNAGLGGVIHRGAVRFKLQRLIAIGAFSQSGQRH